MLLYAVAKKGGTIEITETNLANCLNEIREVKTRSPEIGYFMGYPFKL